MFGRAHLGCQFGVWARLGGEVLKSLLTKVQREFSGGGRKVPRRIILVNLTYSIMKDQKTVWELIYSFNVKAYWGRLDVSVCVVLVVVVVVGNRGGREPAGTVYL